MHGQFTGGKKGIFGLHVAKEWKVQSQEQWMSRKDPVLGRRVHVQWWLCQCWQSFQRDLALFSYPGLIPWKEEYKTQGFSSLVIGKKTAVWIWVSLIIPFKQIMYLETMWIPEISKSVTGPAVRLKWRSLCLTCLGRYMCNSWHCSLPRNWTQVRSSPRRRT